MTHNDIVLSCIIMLMMRRCCFCRFMMMIGCLVLVSGVYNKTTTKRTHTHTQRSTITNTEEAPTTQRKRHDASTTQQHARTGITHKTMHRQSTDNNNNTPIHSSRIGRGAKAPRNSQPLMRCFTGRNHSSQKRIVE